MAAHLQSPVLIGKIDPLILDLFDEGVLSVRPAEAYLGV